MLISSTPFIFKRKNFLLKISPAIIPTPNNCQTNVRNVVKICFQAIWEVKFTISLSCLGVYIEKIKVRLRPPYVEGPLRKILKHQIELDYTPWGLVQASFLYNNLYWNNEWCTVFFLTDCTYIGSIKVINWSYSTNNMCVIFV